MPQNSLGYCPISMHFLSSLLGDSCVEFSSGIGGFSTACKSMTDPLFEVLCVPTCDADSVLLPLLSFPEGTARETVRNFLIPFG